jgi:hypothetical protein
MGADNNVLHTWAILVTLNFDCIATTVTHIRPDMHNIMFSIIISRTLEPLRT